jgi:hypothetical protein
MWNLYVLWKPTFQEERAASIFRIERIREQGRALAIGEDDILHISPMSNIVFRFSASMLRFHNTLKELHYINEVISVVLFACLFEW